MVGKGRPPWFGTETSSIESLIRSGPSDERPRPLFSIAQLPSGYMIGMHALFEDRDRIIRISHEYIFAKATSPVASYQSVSAVDWFIVSQKNTIATYPL